MNIQIFFLLFSIFFFKKKLWWIIADLEFKEKLNHELVNQLEKIPTKYVNMAYMNWVQDHNEIENLLTKTMQWTTQHIN